MSKCRKCKVSIHWAKTITGANMPVNRDPKIDQLFRGTGTVLFDPKRMISHFATCPAADHFRRDRRVPND